ncbi:MAG: hypothetical protein QOI22_85 [Verrucomicrobiota bacterium]|jgi:hypothetical protein
MNNEEMRAQLLELHAELQKPAALDPQQRGLLEALSVDIDQLLQRDENQPHHYRGLSERLSEDLAELEASHPRITLMMRRAIDSLSGLGI